MHSPRLSSLSLSVNRHRWKTEHARFSFTCWPLSGLSLLLVLHERAGNTRRVYWWMGGGRPLEWVALRVSRVGTTDTLPHPLTQSWRVCPSFTSSASSRPFFFFVNHSNRHLPFSDILHQRRRIILNYRKTKRPTPASCLNCTRNRTIRCSSISFFVSFVD